MSKGKKENFKIEISLKKAQGLVFVFRDSQFEYVVEPTFLSRAL